MTFLFGGLQPIWSRVVLDSITILLFGFCISTKQNKTSNTVALLIPVVLTCFTAGLTKRWTLTFPMIPLLVLQQLRRLPTFQGRTWGAVFIAILSTILLLLVIFLCIAFPAVRPPPIQGKYRVGVVDVYLPINFGSSTILGNNQQSGHVLARILYPTDETGSMPYLRPSIASEYLKQSVQMAAPPPIDAWAWFLDNWKLIRLDSKLNAQPISGKKFPIVAYSHGLGGSAIIYSHQTRSLAANGHIVISVDHTDGSAPVVMKKDGSIVLLDTAPIQIFLDGKREEYARTRRAQTEWRARELTGATVALQQLNEQNTPELEALGVSFVDCLDTTQIHAMGHSFGGATALTVAFRRPDLFHSAIAHEPATDWSPDDVRKQIFPHAAIGKWEHEGEAYTGGVGGYQESEAKPLKTTYHQMPVLYLFSDEWYKLNWGNCRFIEQLHKQGSLGLHGDFGVITSAHHNEFSDMCFLTPLWLARALKVTGIRNPIDTAADMVDRTLAFLEDLSPASALQKKAEEVTA